MEFKAKDLKVGDVVSGDWRVKGKLIHSYKIDHSTFMIFERNGLRDTHGANWVTKVLKFSHTRVHRPTPDGLVQVWPEVKDA